MMNFSFMTWSTPELTLRENLDLAVKLGYDGLEPRTSGFLKREDGQKTQKHGVELYTTPAERSEIRRMAEDAGIALCCIATSNKYADPKDVEAQIDSTRRALALCADLGVPRLRVFGGQFPEGLSREEAIEGVANALGKLAGDAQSAGVTLCLETHDAWCHPQHVAAVIKKVNHPAIAVNWDFLHPWRIAKMNSAESFKILKPWIKHAHCHDMKPTAKGSDLCWIGEGEVDHRKAIEVLEEMGYDGYMSGEWINREPDYREHLPRELETLKSYARELVNG